MAMTCTQLDEHPDVAPFKGSEPDMFNEWVEEAVVIACMNDQEIAEITCSIVETDDFMTPGPKHVFDAISNIV